MIFSTGGFGTLGLLQWQLGPPNALQAGAAWQLLGDSSYSTATNYAASITGTNPVTVHFKAIPGWRPPTNQTVAVTPGALNIYSASYTVSNPVLAFLPASGLGLSGTTGTVYRLETRTNLLAGTWLPVSTNTLATPGFNSLLPQSALTNRSGFYRTVWLGQ